MATRPTKFPEWARVPSVDPVTGGANVVEPTEQKKDTGWQREEKPPANYQNWLDNLTYQWLQYLDDNYQSQTGMVECGVYSAAKSGWVKLDDGTIGDASSGATTRANADTEELFTLLWGQVPDTWCPVSGGRGASAAADFSAHKTLTLFKTLGRAIACAGSGAGLTPRVVGENLGEETHQLSTAELASHTHGVQFADNAGFTSTHIAGKDGTPSYVGTQQSLVAGEDSPHNIMQPTFFLNFFIKL